MVGGWRADHGSVCYAVKGLVGTGFISAAILRQASCIVAALLVSAPSLAPTATAFSPGGQHSLSSSGLTEI